jgi:arylsulfatase A-like enzyme
MVLRWRALAGCVCAAMAMQATFAGDPLEAVAVEAIPDTRKTTSIVAPLRRTWRAGRVADRPNIVLIMLDDLDVTDVGVYRDPLTDCQTADDGVCIATPVLDGLAVEGIRFSQYCANGAVCTPTRASILTGQDPARFGFKRGLPEASWRGIPGYVETIAARLRGAGYRTGHIGKWHVGANRDDFLPACKGFDFDVRRTSGDYLDFTLDVNGEVVASAAGEYLTSVLTDYAVAFVQEQPEGQPFFLNLWYHAPHQPLTVPPELPPGFPDYDFDTPRETLAAMVAWADLQIGRVIQEVRQIPNTLVIVTSDNGGTALTHNPDGAGNRGLVRNLRGYKMDVFEGGIRVPMIAWGPDLVGGTPGGFVNASLIGSFDLYPTFAELAGINPATLNVAGESFVELLADPAALKLRDAPLVWENKMANHVPFGQLPPAPNTYAVRDGDWKLVHYFGDFDEPHLALFDLASDPGEVEDRSSEQPEICAALQAWYTAWRREVGDVTYEFEVSESGVTCHKSHRFMFDGSQGVVTVPFQATEECDRQDTRFDFHDGDFTFAAWVRPGAECGESTIAERAGSWWFGLAADGRLRLRVQRDAGDGYFEVNGPVIQPGVPTHVAFTVFGWKAGGYTVRLFVGGELAVEQTDNPVGYQAVAHSDSPITIGNDAQYGLPFTGDIWRPLMSPLSLYPSEVAATLAGEACLADVNADGRVDAADLQTVLRQYGSSGSKADVDCDGRVGLSDLAAVLGELGRSCW